MNQLFTYPQLSQEPHTGPKVPIDEIQKLYVKATVKLANNLIKYLF